MNNGTAPPRTFNDARAAFEAAWRDYLDLAFHVAKYARRGREKTKFRKRNVRWPILKSRWLLEIVNGIEADHAGRISVGAIDQAFRNLRLAGWKCICQVRM